MPCRNIYSKNGIYEAFTRVRKDAQYRSYLVRFVLFTLRVKPESPEALSFRDKFSSEASLAERVQVLQELLEAQFLVRHSPFLSDRECHALLFYQYSSFDTDGTLRPLHLLSKTGSFMMYWIRVCFGYKLVQV